jgi:hypothetical protein
MTNLPAPQSTSQTEISARTERLPTATNADVSDAIRSLLAAGMVLPSSIDPQQAPAVYAFALAGIPAPALKRTVAKLIRGEYEGVNPDYIPRTAQLASLARAEARTMANDLAREKLKAASIAPPKPEKKSPEAIARVRALIAGVRGRHDVSALCSADTNPKGTG